MRRHVGRAVLLGATLATFVAAGLPSAHAIHFYRSTDGGCSAANGALTDDPTETVPNVTATVVLGHNTFTEGALGTGVSVRSLLGPTRTRIKAGESITWTWNSSHCHSVTSYDFVGDTPLFNSGFHYPTIPPESPRVVPGFFEYPILDKTPTLSFTHTFPTAGSYGYYCVHHASIGMTGIVLVDPA